MQTISFQEDPQKLKTSAIRNVAIGVVAAAAGLLVVSNMSRMGYVEMALGGCALGLGIALVFMGIKSFGRVGKAAVTLITADEAGVTLSTGDASTRTIAWAEIQSIRTAKKGVQNGVALELRDPGAYLSALSNQEKKVVKQNQSFFGSPASVNTNLCATASTDICAQLQQLQQAAAPANT